MYRIREFNRSKQPLQKTNSLPNLKTTALQANNLDFMRVDLDTLTGFDREKFQLVLDDGAQRRDDLSGGLKTAAERGHDNARDRKPYLAQLPPGGPGALEAIPSKRWVPRSLCLARPHVVEFIDPVAVPHHYHPLQSLIVVTTRHFCLFFWFWSDG